LNQNTLGQNVVISGNGGNGSSAPALHPAGSGGASYGGAIYNSGPLTLSQNTLSSSYSMRGLAGTGGPADPFVTNGLAQAGGIYNTAVGTNCRVRNSIIALNAL